MRWTRALRSAQWATGITGLHPHPQPRTHLLHLYNATLEAVKTIPEHAVYRQSIEALTKDRIRIVESTEDTNAIEAQIGQGLVEEVIDAAEKELVLVEKIKLWKPYDVATTMLILGGKN
jgi:NADH dehydrogenase (ubiquinone) 1 alpha subcomplex subunit 5